MAVIYEVTVKAGTYQKDGQDMVRYQRIGSVIETKKGPMLKLDQMPLVEGGWEGWAYLFTPLTEEQKEAKRNGFAPKKPSNDGFPDDDIQF
ncbi:MAG: hypothetical protein RL018_1306 [Pseudomonadota bacterium]|jgi:hypothetical protein